MKVIVQIEAFDNCSEEKLAQAGIPPESLKAMYEVAFRKIMSRIIAPGARYTMAVQVEDNTKEVTNDPV